VSQCSQTTTAVRAAIDSDKAHGAIVPPLCLSSNFSFQGYAQPRQYDYTRSGNPTRDALAGALADLEGGAAAVVTCTGMAAVTLALQLVPEGGLLVAPHDVSRVIARPFRGTPGAWKRTANRRDYSIQPPGPTLLDKLAEAGIPRAGVGKVDDLFAGRSLTSRHTADNAEGVSALIEWLSGPARGFCFANLVDFDQLYGHRNDVPGFQGALEAFDRALPSLLDALREDDLLFITADHGNDPTTPSSDHARERVPVLAVGARVHGGPVGERDTFSDLGATVAEWFGLSWRGRGTSFLPTLLRA